MKKESNKKKPAKDEMKTPADLEIAMIKARLKLPMEKRTGFLRKRRPDGGSSI